MGVVLLVASPGGHIDELYDFAPRILKAGSHRIWVTAKTPQTESLLEGEETIWVPQVASRQGGRALAALPQALRLIHRHSPRLVLSTGAALATPYLLAARAYRAETHYIESATRLNGPSLTGQLMANVPGVRLHHQGFRTASSKWTQVSSVFDSYAPGPSVPGQVRRVVVILGTERFPFPRALDQVERALSPAMTTLLQTGHTPVEGRAGTYRPWVPFYELAHAVAEADVVVSHAGVGSILSALRAGKHPIVIPRAADLGEHVDDHQFELAQMLDDRGLVTVSASRDDLGDLLVKVAGRSSVRAQANSIEL